MKKFSLLALVAVMVMAFAGASFADDGDLRKALTVTSIGSYAADQNNGAVDNNATKVYHYGTLSTAKFKLGVHLTSENGTDIAASEKIGGFVGEPETYIDSSIAGELNTAVDKDATFSDVANDTTAIKGIAVYEGTSDPTAAAATGATLTLTKTEVKFDTTTPITEGKSKDQTIELRFVKDVEIKEDVIIAVVPTGLAAAEFGSDLEVDGTITGLTLTPSETGLTIEKGTPTAAGPFEITLKTASTENSLKVKETAAGSGIVVAAESGALNGKEVAKIKVVVELAKTNNATFLPDDKTTLNFFVEDVTSALVISTDISTDKVPAAKSADLKLYVGDDALNAKSFDVALAAAGYTFSLPVATQQDLAPITAASVYVTDDTNVMTNKLALSITNKSVYPVDQPTAEQKAAIEALVAGSADLGLTTAVSHDADSAFVSDDIPSAISNDVRGYFEIDQAVPNNGDYVAMDGTRFTTNKKTGESVTFFKNFGTNEDPDRISLRDAMSGDVLQAAVLIVDNELPANVQGAWKSAKDSKKGVVIRKVNGTNVVVIYDGNKNGRVVDPIEARVNRGSSSSSCDMGFGLAAVAGLAALALRKRSK